MKHRFERLTDQITHGGVLTPYLEQALLFYADKVWPTEYAIKVVNKERRWDGYFHPSSHANVPELLLYYLFHPDIRVKQESHTVSEIMTFQIGSAYHAVVQSMLIHLGFTTPEECEVSFVNEDRWCSGTVDVRKINVPDGRILPMEIKSAAYLPKEPRPDHLRQFQVYMDLGCETPQDEGILLYIAKGSPHSFREFAIKRSEIILSEVYGKWRNVLEAIDLNDPGMLQYPCHVINSKEHFKCAARDVCILGKPYGA